MLRLSKLQSAALLNAATLAFGGCASSTPYQSAQSTGTEYGYSSEQLASDRYRVMFEGNDFTSRETVENYLLYRAAELTRQNGYSNFTLLNDNTQRELDVDTVPATTYAGAYPGWGPTWYYGTGFGTAYDPFLGSTYPAQRIQTSDQYRASATIRMYNGTNTDARGPTFDAADVLARLGDNVEMPEM